MGQVALLALVAAGTAVAVHEQRQSAGAQQVELDLAKRQEEQAARDREVQRKRRLVAILGSQQAEAAAGGTALSGSIANISITDAKRAAEDSLIDQQNTSTRIAALGRERRTIGRLQRAESLGTILSAGEKIAARGKIGGGSKPPSSTGGVWP